MTASAGSSASYALPGAPASAPTGQAEAEPPSDASLAGASGCATWQRTPLMIAARHGQLGVVERYLETSCSQPTLDALDERGDSALIIAARHGHLEVVRAVLAAGADTGIRNMDGKIASEVTQTDAIRAAITSSEAKMDELARAILSGATGSGSALGGGVAGGRSGSTSGGLNLAALMASLDLDGTGFKASPGECPF